MKLKQLFMSSFGHTRCLFRCTFKTTSQFPVKDLNFKIDVHCSLNSLYGAVHQLLYGYGAFRNMKLTLRAFILSSLVLL